MSLRNKFLIVVFISLFIPILIIGYVVYFNMNQVLEQNITQINHYLLDRLHMQIENELTDMSQTFDQIISSDTIGIFLMGSKGTFDQRMKVVLEENPLIQRVYVRPTGLVLAKDYEYPQFSEEKSSEKISKKSEWEEKWIENSAEDLQKWYGPYLAADNRVSIIYPGPAFSIRQSREGLVVFEVNVQSLVDKVAGDINSQTKHLHFVTATGQDYLTGKDYHAEGFFSDLATDQRTQKLVTIDGKKYLAFMQPCTLLNGYILVLEDESVAFQSRQNVNQTIFLVSCIAFILALLLMAWCVQYMLIKPLRVVQKAAGKVADGNLTVKAELKKKDEIGQVVKSFNQMTDSLRDVIQVLIQSGDEVHSATQQFFSSFKGLASTTSENNLIINELAKIAEDQSINLSESSNLANDISSSIIDFAEQMTEVKDNSKRVLEHADQGQSSIAEALEVIQKINVNVQQILVGMDDLKVKSDEINEITDLINQITDQTNLLALNASIEAARAGDAGVGFAVVAQEIRNLADQSRQATERIGLLINQVQTRVKQVNEEIQDQTAEFSEGVKITEIAGKTFGRIVTDILAVDQMINQMNSHIEKVKSSGASIAKNIENVAAQAQESAASSEEIAVTSEESLKVVEKLSQLVTNLEGLSKNMSELKARFEL